ncbi:MAG: hypothetical protein ACOY3E_12860 [Pseudomonadota bacterium]
MNRSSLLQLLAVLGGVSVAGCSTVVTHVTEPAHIHPYKGTAAAMAGVARAWQDPIIPGEAPVRAALDVPLCLAADTVLLPVDWLIWLSNR